ncbi:aquaporin [bacterium]|nr:aquaporin [bacterium]
MLENFKKYFVELIGTFFLVLTVGLAGVFGAEGVIAPLAIASVLMVMVYAGGHISGGHYNPAVSLAAAIRGALPWKQFVPYIIAQAIGAALAVLAVCCLHCGEEAAASEFCLKGLICAEMLFTFALCYVVLQTATTKDTTGNSYYGLAIGFTVLVGAFAVGGVNCAGAFNPAVALGVGMMKVISWAAVGYTVLANFVAGALAALVFKLTYTEAE